MNDFFGMTPERLQEIQDQIKEIGLSLQPLHDAAAALMNAHDPNAEVSTLEEAQLIATAGLLARLDQGLGEAHFWTQGVQQYMAVEDLDMVVCTNVSRIVVEAYGGMRDMADPYAKGPLEIAMGEVLGMSGLIDTLGGLGVVVRVTREEEPAPEPTT